MIVYPAIDLKDGICVRLMHGRFDAVTRYDDQPAARLAAFAAAGATWAHIVDLDGRREVELKLPGRYRLDGALRGALKSAPGVVLLEDA